MPSYKLVYFNARGRAEAARILFAYVGQEYEDVRYSHEEWAKHKAAVPLQQLPYLEYDGLPIPQSGAILGFLSRKFGLNGANNEETTKIEMVYFTLEDVFQPLGAIFREKDEANKKKLQEEYATEKAPRYFKGLEDLLNLNGGGDGYFVGSKISQADIAFFATMDIIRQDEVLKKFPKLVALRDRIAKEPKIAAHLEKRPKTDF